MDVTASRADGLVVATHGRHCVVEDARGAAVLCHPRGKKNTPLVGDRVVWVPSGDGGQIVSILPRRNLFLRQDAVRSKPFAANIDQVLVLGAAEPMLSEALLARALIAAEAAGIRALVALNKSDRQPAFDQAWERLAPYRSMGYPMLALSLKSEPQAALRQLMERMDAAHTLVVGPSGAGKSTLVNLLAPQAGARTGELSQALASGRHTTTATRWYWLDGQRRSAVVDSPGFQTFGLSGLAATDLARCMPDFRPLLGQCRFANCSHRQEPGCAIHEALQAANNPGGISASRYKIYTDLYGELDRPAW